MAATWQVQATGVPLALANESLFSIYNNNATSIVSIYRIWIQNNEVTPTTASQNILTLTRNVAPTYVSNSMLWTPVSMDSTNAAFPSGIICASKETITSGTAVILRRRAWTNNQPAVQTALPAVLQLPGAWNVLWDTSYNDMNVEPLVLRQTVCMIVQNVGLTATAPANAGMVDIFCEFTVT
jgi:hypothetical protein